MRNSNNELYDSIALLKLRVFCYIESVQIVENSSAPTLNLEVNWAIPAFPENVAASQLH